MSNTLKRIRDAHEEDQGFTLIELLMVIIILAILAAVVVFSVTGITSTGTTAACQTQVKTIDTAAESYFAQIGTPAGTIGDLVTKGFLHADGNFKTTSGTSVGPIGNGTEAYTITFTAGPPGAGGADSTTCPAT